VLDAKAGYWQDRKRAWLALGIESELGRASNGETKRFTFVAGTREYKDLDPVSKKILDTGSGTSIFDPVLCECVYTWFSPDGGMVLDPFAGGSVRGIVAGHTGRKYLGIELRGEQVRANLVQQEKILDDRSAEWICGDSRGVLKEFNDEKTFDLVFSCPPYADLEVYSDHPRDLSNMDYETFKRAYFDIIKQSVRRLKNNRFAVWVVGEARSTREKEGYYYGLVPDTIRAFEDAGARYYNEIMLLTAIGSLPIRVTKQFQRSRKVGRTHQTVLVFVKGDPRIAAAVCNRKRLVRK